MRDGKDLYIGTVLDLVPKFGRMTAFVRWDGVDKPTTVNAKMLDIFYEDDAA